MSTYLAQKIIDLRTEHSLTQRQLSEITGVKQSQIARWESGIAKPSPESLEKIARPLGYEVEISFKRL